MYGSPYSFHHRRARHHRLFARGSRFKHVRQSHAQLAAVYWSLAAYMRAKRKA
ncbi:MAG: hypothetical protein J7494_14280 [Sphingobium sp.]|nr:hypothetical protein [Sphingobium sp.]